MKVFAIGSFARPLTDEERKQTMPKEVPDTLQLYLEGKIDHFWFREDKLEVGFLMNAETVEGANVMIDTLVLAAKGYLVFEYLLVAPLRPLGLLIQPHESKQDRFHKNRVCAASYFRWKADATVGSKKI